MPVTDTDRTEAINTAWKLGYEAGKAGQKGRPPYDSAWQFMPWLDGYTAGSKDRVSLALAQVRAAA